MSAGVIEVGPHFVEFPDMSGTFQCAKELFGGGDPQHRGPNPLWWSDIVTKTIGAADKFIF